MAITYEAAGNSPFSTSTTTFSFTPDAGVQANDVFVVAVSHRNNSTVTVPSGTAETPISKAEMTAGDRYVTVFAWVASGTSTSPVTFALSVSTPGAVAWARFRGVDTTDPVNVSSPGTYTYPTPNPAPSVTTTVANTYLVGGIMLGSGSATPGVPAGWTSRATTTVSTGLIATKGVQASAGASGSASFTSSPTTTNSIAWQLALRPAAAVASPSLTYSVLGAVTDGGASVRARCADTTSIRLKVATNSGLTTGVVFSSSQSVDSDGTAGVSVTGLSADTAYYYGVEMTGPGGTVTSAAFGPFTTWPNPGTAESFSFAFGSCHSYAETTSSVAFTRISARNPRLFFHLGDFHYADNTSSSQASHLNDLATQINQLSGLKTLMANVPTVYSKSDHDSGDNGSFPGAQTPGNRGAYLQTFPTYTRPDSDGLYQSFVLGRVRFIVLDTRYFAEEDGSTRLGATQKAWLFDELVQPEPVKVIVQEGTWIDDRPAVLGDDTWEWFDAERTEIGNYVQSDAVGKVVMIHGDQHALAADDGSHNPWGGFPTMCAAPFGQWASVKTQNPATDWSQGIWAPESPAVQQYGFVNVTDDGTTISLAYTGYDSSNTSRVTLTTTAVSVTRTASFTGSGTLSATATAAATIPAAFSGSGALSAVVETAEAPQRAASFTGTGTLSATRAVAVTAGFTGSGALSAVVSGAWARDAAFTGAGVLSASVTSRIARTAGFTGSGTLTASVSVPGVVAAQFTGAGSLSAVVSSVAPETVAADFTGAGSLTADVAAVYTFTVFTPPTVGTRWPVTDRFWSRLTMTDSYSVLKLDGFYRQVSDPSNEDVAAADVAYLGGRRYRVDDAEVEALTEAGYGEYLSTEEVFV